ESYMIWITGDAVENVLSQAEIDSIKAYLISGGNVILSGQNIAEYLANTSNPFLQDWLHVNFLENMSVKMLDGGLHQISNNVSRLGIFSSSAANNQDSPDALTLDADNLAKPVYEYRSSNGKYGAVGIEYPDYDSKLFFAAFGLEAVYSRSESFISRDGLLTRISDWFNGLTNIDDLITTYPDIYQLKQNFPNPFNPSTIIEYNLPEKTNVKLEVFSLTGQKLISLVNKSQSKGVHSVTFIAGNM
ncbi:MAG: T9SS type A sorting domain-containing protein, partial [Gammaproteobacteria bacterium]|nr:T9SS type A sorting domain-containing protein [Gammaproteobacteria bacterium]